MKEWARDAYINRSVPPSVGVVYWNVSPFMDLVFCTRIAMKNCNCDIMDHMARNNTGFSLKTGRMLNFNNVRLCDIELKVAKLDSVTEIFALQDAQYRLDICRATNGTDIEIS